MDVVPKGAASTFRFTARVSVSGETGHLVVAVGKGSFGSKVTIRFLAKLTLGGISAGGERYAARIHV